MSPRVGLFGTSVTFARRARLVFWLVSWVPLVVLTALSSPAALDTFLVDAEALARLFVGMPALLLGGGFVDRYLSRAVDELYGCGLLPDASREPLTKQLQRCGSGLFLWLLLLALAAFALSINAFEDATSALRGWRQEGAGYSAAGAWYRWVSTTAYRYLWLRLAWGLILWVGAMGLVARFLEPCLLHPDRRAGLGRFVLAHAAFAPVVFGLSGSAAGSLANQLLHQGRALEDVRFLLIAFVVLIQLPVLATLVPLVLPLYRAKQRTLDRLSAVAVPWSRLVEPHLVESAPPPSPSTHDLAAHADLIATYTVVEQTSVLPWRKSLVLTLAAFTMLPMIPVLLLGVPLQEILSKVTKLL